MRSHVLANDDRVVAWVSERTGVMFCPPFTSLGFIRNGKIVAGIVFHMWTVCDVEMGAAIEPGGITRRDLKGVARYVFDLEDKRRVTLVTPESNTKAREIAERLGFSFECRKEHLYLDEDGISYRMLREECPWR